MAYAWGSRSALSELLGRAPSGAPEAELWIGAHPSGSARLAPAVAGTSTLLELLKSDLPGLLGADLAARYGRLPFLLKILAIDAPLSLQAHPDAEQARAGFAREQALGLSLSDPARNYRDDNHKPELILALSPVEALSGFRPRVEVSHLLSTFGLTEVESPLAEATGAFLRTEEGERAYEALFRSFFTLPREDLRSALRGALSRAEQAATATASFGDVGWVARLLLRLDREYGTDPGLLGAILLGPLRLEPGQALFLPARRLHAYLSGVGVEVMAESDNVLRGGLTPKHVDIGELSRVLDFRPTRSEPVVPTSIEDAGVRIFRTPAEEFELWSIEAGGKRPIPVPSPSLFVVLEGRVEFTQGSERAIFERGGQGFVPWSSERALLHGQGRLALAAVRSDVPS